MTELDNTSGMWTEAFRDFGQIGRLGDYLVKEPILGKRSVSD